jgi:molecular chaperone GrpE (heat shock protein)
VTEKLLEIPNCNTHNEADVNKCNAQEKRIHASVQNSDQIRTNFENIHNRIRREREAAFMKLLEQRPASMKNCKIADVQRR